MPTNRPVLAAFITILVSVPAMAAKANEPVKAGPVPMQVVIARSSEPGCEPQCLEWISAQGMINGSTPRQFKKVLSSLGQRKLPVLVDSTGGTVDDGLAIGRMIRAKGLDVIVTKTAFMPCEKTDLACNKQKGRNILAALPRAELSKCASSCAFILAGGVRRFVGASTFVGLHQVATFQIKAQILRTYRVTTQFYRGVPMQQQKSLVAEKKISEERKQVQTPEAVYEKVKAYFAEMGIADGVMPILMSTPNTGMRWLRGNELVATNLATDFLNGEQLLLPAKPLAPAPGPAPIAAAQPPAGMSSFGSPPVCNPATGIVTACELSPSNVLATMPTATSAATSQSVTTQSATVLAVSPPAKPQTVVPSAPVSQSAPAAKRVAAAGKRGSGVNPKRKLEDESKSAFTPSR